MDDPPRNRACLPAARAASCRAAAVQVGFDSTCAREPIITSEDGRFYLFYNGASEKGWVVNLAVSDDLQHWQKLGPLFPIGRRGEPDRFAVSPWVIREGDTWHMFYIGADGAEISEFPYLTFKASSASLTGPWAKQPEVVPFRTQPGTYYSVTASAGHNVSHAGDYLQFIGSTTRRPGHPYVLRTLGCARTKDLNGPWQVDPQPILPVDEQVENTSLYYEPANGVWFLFTNHIGLQEGVDEYTDAAWVYWSADLDSWEPRNKAVVLDGSNCTWSKRCIGMPSVMPVGDKLAVFYDAPGGESTSHWGHSIGLAWLDLPLRAPTERCIRYGRPTPSPAARSTPVRQEKKEKGHPARREPGYQAKRRGSSAPAGFNRTR